MSTNWMNERMCKKKQLKHKIFSVENDSGSYLNLRANTNTSHITVHTRGELKTNQFHVFSSLFAHSFRSFTYYYTDANFFFILYLFVCSIIRSTWQCGTVQIMVGKRHKTMFLWSAYMNNEKTFVIEILVLGAISRLLMMMIFFFSAAPIAFYSNFNYSRLFLGPIFFYMSRQLFYHFETISFIFLHKNAHEQFRKCNIVIKNIAYFSLLTSVADTESLWVKQLLI